MNTSTKQIKTRKTRMETNHASPILNFKKHPCLPLKSKYNLNLIAITLTAYTLTQIHNSYAYKTQLITHQSKFKSWS